MPEQADEELATTPVVLMHRYRVPDDAGVMVAAPTVRLVAVPPRVSVIADEVSNVGAVIVVVALSAPVIVVAPAARVPAKFTFPLTTLIA